MTWDEYSRGQTKPSNSVPFCSFVLLVLSSNIIICIPDLMSLEQSEDFGMSRLSISGLVGSFLMLQGQKFG